MSADRIDVLAVMDAEAAAVNRIRRSLGEWLGRMEDTNWDVNGSGGPDESDLSDLNNAVIRLRAARAAVAELIKAATDHLDAGNIANLSDARCEELAARYCGDEAPTLGKVLAATEDRLRAALVRVGGAA